MVRVARWSLVAISASHFVACSDYRPDSPPIEVEPEGPCSTSIDPPFGAVRVDVVSPIRVRFGRPVDQSTLDEAFTLTRVGRAESIPFERIELSDREVELRPVGSLAFFENYALTVTGVTSRSGEEPCATEETVFSTWAPEAEMRPLRPAPARDLAIVGDTAIVASPTYRGLQVYDVTTPSAPLLLREVLTDGPPLGVVIDGDRAYVPAGAFGIYVFDITEPREPKLAGVAGTPGQALEVVPFTEGATRYLAVADGPGGFRILDVTEAEGAKDVAALQPSGDPTANVVGLAMDGSLAVVAQHVHGFALVDVSSPALPIVLASRESEAVADTFFGARWVNDVDIGDGTAFVSLANFGVQAFDVTNPQVPIYLDHSVGPQGLCNFGCPDEILDVVYQDGVLYAASAMSGAARFSFDGSSLDLAATLPVAGRSYSVETAGPNLWVGSERGLALFDRNAGDGSSPVFEESSGWGTAQGILAKGEHVYVGSSSRGLETFSLSNPLEPTPASLVVTAGVEADVGLLNLVPVGDLLVLGDGRAGLSVFDTLTPAAPVLVGSIAGADTLGAMVTYGDLLFACDGTYALWTVDLTDPASPKHTSQQIAPEVGGCYGLTLNGTALYLAGSKGLGVYDVSSGLPVLESALVLPADDILFSIAARGHHLYATTYAHDHEGTHGTAQRLVAFDITEATRPVRVFKSEDLGGANDLSIRGDKLFVSGRGEGIWVWGLGNPSEPDLEGQIDLPGDAYRLTHAPGDGRVLYVSQRGGGLGVIEVGKLPSN